MAKKRTRQEEIAHEEKYQAFLQKQVGSKNYRLAVTEEEFQKTKAKLDKVKFRLKILKGK